MTRQRISASAKAAMLLMAGALFITAHGQQFSDEAPIFITIGQSNADGSAFFDPEEDALLNQWYTSQTDSGKLKIWYRSTQVKNVETNALDERARHVIDGKVKDMPDGWLDLWYRNENALGRTAMNMIHGYGTYSTGSDTNCAQGRRGMEGSLGMHYSTLMPGLELYILKLGVSGSFISSWANPLDDTNWNYFYEHIFKPAIADLLARGKRPVLTGVWWSQGCADSGRTAEYYAHWLQELIERCRRELGFAGGKFYLNHILAPGESAIHPDGSVAYGKGVRQAQDSIAALLPGVTVIDVDDVTMQYEPAFSGFIHFDHAGQNRLGEKLAKKITASGGSDWVKFSTPGRWRHNDSTISFVPTVGNPHITYSTRADSITATLHYPGWSEIKTTTATTR